MAYFIGTADSLQDLLNKVAAHAQTLGWTTDRRSDDEWCCHNGEGFWSIKLKPATGDWELCGNTGFDTAASWDNQPGNSRLNTAYPTRTKATRFALGNGPYSRYHLFATRRYLHLQVEIASGSYRPMMIGTLDRRGLAYQGGQYVCGCYIDTGYKTLNYYRHEYPFDSYGGYSSNSEGRIRIAGVDELPEWFRFYYSASEYRAIGLGRGYYDSFHPASLLVESSANALNGETILTPCSIYIFGKQERTRYIGDVPDFAVCRMDYLAAGERIVAGSDEWIVLPLIQRGEDSQDYSGMVGYAYRVVA